jgi:formylglycine-generating enzyme required for sulfatase activity
MVLVPAGEFKFGDSSSPHERPQTVIQLDSFYIDKYEVSNAEFNAVFPTHAVEPGTENYPVRGVSWKQALEYAKAAGKRLPTEREWEKAARGTEGWQWPWGNTFDPSRVTFKKDALPTLPVEVGEHKLGVSPYGCMNMSGNVYEWVHDWYEAYPGNNEIAAEYGQVFRVLRGGSFKSDQYATRSAARHFDIMDAKKDDYGFRCAMDVKDVPGAPRAVAPPVQ